MRKLFGTDGIRGIAGQHPLDQRTVFAIGQALGYTLARKQEQPSIVIGQDTRESSRWIADAVAAGLLASGCHVESAGVITTPGVAYIARSRKFAAGVVVSASHNPWQDNGIKVFGGDGYKLPDAVELAIEKEIFSILESMVSQPRVKFESLPGDPGLRRVYEGWLTGSVTERRMGRLRAVVDCANGAASQVAPHVFGMLNLNAEFINTDPNGRNINTHCGALHPELVGREVVARGADLGITLDGDADRAMFADHTGKVANGDAVLLVAARALKGEGKLAADTVVATTMSNMGLEAALRRSGIRMLRAPVGDKYVLEEMQKSGAALGGEQSGHMIFANDATTGDGLLTALKVLEMISRAGKSLAELTADLHVFPQVIVNIKVREKKPLNDVPEVANAIRIAESALDGNGRVVVRYSGTEALARVMIEAESEESMNEHAHSIAGAIRETLGA